MIDLDPALLVMVTITVLVIILVIILVRRFGGDRLLNKELEKESLHDD